MKLSWQQVVTIALCLAAPIMAHFFLSDATLKTVTALAATIVAWLTNPPNFGNGPGGASAGPAVKAGVAAGAMILALGGCSAAADQAAANDIAKALPYEKVACAMVAESTDPAVVAPLCAFADAELPVLVKILQGKAMAKLAKQADAGAGDAASE